MNSSSFRRAEAIACGGIDINTTNKQQRRMAPVISPDNVDVTYKVNDVSSIHDMFKLPSVESAAYHGPDSTLSILGLRLASVPVCFGAFSQLETRIFRRRTGLNNGIY